MATENENARGTAPELAAATRPSRGQRFFVFVIQPKYGIPLALLVTLVLSPVAYRGSRLAGVPDMGDPFDVEEFGTVEIRAEDNAFLGYVDAASLLVAPELSDVEGFDDEKIKSWSDATTGMRDALERNRPALERWQQATTKPDALYIQPKDVAFDTLLPAIQGLREFARLGLVEGLRLESNGDVDEAWAVYRAMFRSSRHSGLHGGLIERLVGIAMYSKTIRSMTRWSAHPQVTAGQLERAIDELSSDYKLTASPSVSLKAEYLMQLNMSTTPELQAELLREAGIPPMLTGIGLYAIGEPELSRRVTRQVFANWLENIDKPRHARPSRRGGVLDLFEQDPAVRLPPNRLTADEIQRVFPRSVIAKFLLPAFSQFDVAVSREEARQAALITVLRVQLYYRKHGMFPKDLDTLIDDHKSALPTDPLGKAGQRLHYRRDEDGAIVWSVGENGVDDGGSIEFVSGKPPDIGIRFKAPITRK